MLLLQNPHEITLGIARRFRKARLGQNITLSDLERMSGVAQPTIQRFETTGRTTLSTLAKLADALGLGEALAALTLHEDPVDIDAIVKKRPPRQRARSTRNQKFR